MSTATNFSDSFPFSLSQMNAEIRDIGASTSTDNPPIFDCHQRSDFAVGGDKIQELYTFQQRASDNMSWSFAKEDDSTGDLTRESVEECPLSLIQDSQKEAAANKYQQSDGFGIEKEDDDDDNKPCEEHRVDLDCEVKIKISDKSRLSAIEVAGFNLSFVALFIGLAFAVLIGIPSFFGQEMLLATKKVFVLKDLVSGLPYVFYVMSMVTILFSLCTGILIVVLYSIPRGNLMVLVSIIVIIVIIILYGLLANFIMPKFTVRIGPFYLQSSPFMWLLAVSTITFAALVLLVWQRFLLPSAKWLKTKMGFSDVQKAAESELPSISTASNT